MTDETTATNAAAADVQDGILDLQPTQEWHRLSSFCAWA